MSVTDNPENPTGAVRIRDMPWEQMMNLLRSIGPEVGRLAKLGEKTAVRVRAVYQYCYDHPGDMKANANLRVAVEDYMNRDLRDGERFDLGVRFGHRLPEPEKQTGPRVVVPHSVKTKQ